MAPPGGEVLVLTRSVEYGDVVGGELVLAAHSDEQGAASPARRHKMTARSAQRFLTRTSGLSREHSN